MNNKNAEISARIIKIVNDIAISPNSFGRKLAYDRGQTIYDIINGKSAPSYEFFKRFMLSEYSVIYNIDWLLTGRGTMLIPLEHPEQIKEGHNIQVKDTTPIEKDLITLIREKDDKIEKLSRLAGRLEAEIALQR